MQANDLKVCVCFPDSFLKGYSIRSCNRLGFEIGKYQKPIDGNLDINGKQILAQQTPFTQKWLLIIGNSSSCSYFLLTMIPMFFNDCHRKKKEKNTK